MLKNDLLDLTLFFDLEWVPDAAGAQRLLGLPETISEREAIVELWKYSGATAENPRPFVKYLFSRVVSIAFLSRRTLWRDGVKETEFKLHSLPKLPLTEMEVDEAYIIERFLYFIGEREPNLVGYNSNESDLQVLIQRGLVNEITSPRFCARPQKPWEGRDYFYRFGEEHLDLLRLFSNGNMKPTLNELARLCGFPGKTGTSGGDVVDLWLDRDVRKIVEYNQLDALNTYLLWLRVVRFCGKLSDEEYQSEQFQFRDFLEEESAKPNGGHIRMFIDNWPL
jgi:3'-5' exonuclease